MSRLLILLPVNIFSVIKSRCCSIHQRDLRILLFELSSSEIILKCIVNKYGVSVWDGINSNGELL